MGFHFVTRVYDFVTGTSSTAQSVLAYLAHRADDTNLRPCHPSIEQIESATHFRKSAVKAALRELKEAKLISWTSGGRAKGGRGTARANDYIFHLPTEQGSPNDPHQIVSNMNQPSIIDDVDGMSASGADGLRQLVETWRTARAAAEEKSRMRQSESLSLIDEAMRVCGANDSGNKLIFTKAMLGRDGSRCLEEILTLESEVKAGEHQGVRNLASVLTKRLSALPRSN